ncbi:DNA polymerase [Fredinandcohnia humi]
MELEIKLSLKDDDSQAVERVKKAVKKKTASKETIEQAWERVLSLAGNTEADLQKLYAVKRAFEEGKVGRDSDKRFSKAEALRMWQQLQEIERDEKLEKLVAETPDNYILVQTEKQLNKLVQDLKNEPIIAVDTETTGLDVYNDEIVGISLTLPNADYHVYIPVAHTTGKQLKRDVVLKALEPTLTSPFIGKVLHNAKFDIHMFIRHGLRMRGLAHDTQIAMAILNENETSFALKNLATKYGKHFGFKDESYTFEELFGKNAKFADVPLDVALVYAAKDTHLTYKLYSWQLEHLKKRDRLLELYQKLENPLIEVCIDMEQNGFLIDLEFAKEYGTELQEEIVQIEKKLKHFFGDINFNSPSQLQEVLYDVLELPDISKNRSTDKATLKKLKNHHKGIDFLLQYRDLTKLLGTYIEALPSQIKKDGRIHGSFNQVSTVTGRFSSNNPNLQNLPPKARKLIIAPEGKLILGIDFSQIEPRVLAHMSNDKKLQEPYLKGQDLYSTLASQVFNVPLEECVDGSKYRKMMKVGLLAVMYGTSMFTLAEQLGITVEEAHKFIQDFFKTYPDVHQFINDTHQYVKDNEFVETLYGRKRRFPTHTRNAREYDALVRKMCSILGTNELPLNFWEYKELPYDTKRSFQKIKGEVERVRRMAVNARIQGTAADIMKRALLNIHAHVKPKGWEVIGTVHDEALMLVDSSITLKEIEEIEACMIRSAELDVPLKVDTEIMTRWGEGYKKGEWFQLVA